MFFTDEPSVAEDFGDYMVPVYAALRNPLDLSEFGSTDNDVFQAIEDASGVAINWDEESLPWEFVAAPAVSKALRERGYDGVIFNDYATPSDPYAEYTSYVSYRSDQIKSAVGNRGTYDPGNPDIRYAVNPVRQDAIDVERFYSRSSDTRQAYEQRIDELFEPGAAANTDGVRVLDQSDVLGLLGYPGYPVHLAEGKVLAGQENHNLSAGDWKQVPEWLENPAAVFESETVPGSLVFLAPEAAANGTPILITIVPDTQAGRASAHIVTNAYDTGHLKTPFSRWIREGRTRYYHPRKSLSLGTTAGLRLPGVVHPKKGSNQTVHGPNQLRKYRSDRRRDFRGPRSDQSRQAAEAAVAYEQALAERLGKLRRRLPVRMETRPPEQVFNDPAAAGVEGAYHNGEIVLFPGNIASTERALQVLRHESIGHFGMQRILGDKFGPTLARVRQLADDNAKVAAISQQVRERYRVGEPGGLDENSDTFVEEVIAAMAENRVDLPIIRRIFGEMRAFLRRLGLYDKDITQDELYALIAQAGRYAYGKGRMPASASDLRDAAAAGAPRFSRPGAKQRGKSDSEYTTLAAARPGRLGRTGAIASDKPTPVQRLPNPHALIQRLRAHFGIPLRQGRITNPKAAGEHNKTSGVIRQRNMADIEVFSHEAGHFLESKYGQALTALIARHREEVAPLSYDPTLPDEQLLREGFARSGV